MKYPQLYAYICQLNPIPQTEWKLLEDISRIKQLKKGDILVEQGSQAQDIYIIISGSLRMFYIEDNGKEFNHSFMFEGNLAAAYPSLVTQSPSKFAIGALEDTTILGVPFDKFDKFYDRHPTWDRLARKALEVNYLDKLERESILLQGDTYQKYCRAVELYPEIKLRVSQYHIASFIGVSAEALNRVLKKNS
jgi:CRP-like cAMP-binding protein